MSIKTIPSCSFWTFACAITTINHCDVTRKSAFKNSLLFSLYASPQWSIKLIKKLHYVMHVSVLSHSLTSLYSRLTDNGCRISFDMWGSLLYTVSIYTVCVCCVVSSQVILRCQRLLSDRRTEHHSMPYLGPHPSVGGLRPDKRTYPCQYAVVTPYFGIQFSVALWESEIEFDVNNSISFALLE